MRTSLLKMSLVALGMVISTGAFAAEDLMATVESPGKVLKVSLQVAPDGRLSYQVERNGQPVIAPSRLGFVLASDKPLDAGFAMERHLVTAHDSTWEQPWGERRTVRNHYSQLRVDVHQKRMAGAWRSCFACSTMAWASATNSRSRPITAPCTSLTS